MSSLTGVPVHLLVGGASCTSERVASIAQDVLDDTLEHFERVHSSFDRIGTFEEDAERRDHRATGRQERIVGRRIERSPFPPFHLDTMLESAPI